MKFVQKARKLEFTHPIPVEFLSDAAFKKRVRHDDAKVTASDRRDAKRYVAELRALGLLQGNVDLIGAEKNLSGVDTLGYYDQDAKKMVIRGKNLADVATRVTVVHELTHALQDQHFDLNKLTDATKTSGADTALTALIEGDAVRVENKYVDVALEGGPERLRQDPQQRTGRGDARRRGDRPRRRPADPAVFSTKPPTTSARRSSTRSSKRTV